MKFKELRIGMTFTLNKTILKEDVVSFAEISGDRNPIHLDKEYAEKSIFKGRIVHGMLIGSYFSKAIASDLPGPGSIYLNQTMQFMAPVYHNSNIKIEINVVELKKEKQIVILSTNCYVAKELVIRGEAIVKCLN